VASGTAVRALGVEIVNSGGKTVGTTVVGPGEGCQKQTLQPETGSNTSGFPNQR
jgi:hypothetical protein